MGSSVCWPGLFVLVGDVMAFWTAKSAGHGNGGILSFFLLTSYLGSGFLC